MRYITLIQIVGCLVLISSCITHNSMEKKNNKIDFSNKTDKPIYPNCISSSDKDICLQEGISKLILKEALKRNLVLKNDTLKLGVQINSDGTTTVLENETNNSKLRILSHDVLTNLPIIEPAFSEKLNKYVSVGYSFYILIKDNSLIKN